MSATFEIRGSIIIPPRKTSATASRTWQLSQYDVETLGWDYQVINREIRCTGVSPTESFDDFTFSIKIDRVTRDRQYIATINVTSDTTSITKRTVYYEAEITIDRSNEISECEYLVNQIPVNKLIRPYKDCSLTKCLDDDYFIQADGCGSYYGKETTDSSPDTWNEKIELSEYAINNITKKFVVPGSKPQFNTSFAGNIGASGAGISCCRFYESTSRTSNSIVKICRDNTQLRIYYNTNPVETYYPFDFNDGVIPTKILLAIQGSGGSGANGNWNTSSGAGGGGGFWLGVVDLTKGSIYDPIDPTYATRCAGFDIILGYGEDDQGGEASGRTGKKSGLRWFASSFEAMAVTVNGGTGGSYGGNGGGGGSVSTTNENSYVWTLYSDSGEPGGSVGNNGIGKAESTTYATKITSDQLGINKLILPAVSGGTKDKGGGGGSSRVAKGGNGGKYSGGDGTYGSGGGGAGSGWGDNPRGGRGGQSCCWLWF